LHDLAIKQISKIPFRKAKLLLCKKQEPSFVVGHFSYIVNVFDYKNSSQASANRRFVSRTEVLKLF